MLAVAYYAFYGTLGVSPTDVGLDYITTLSSSVGALILLAALIIYTLIAISLPYAWLSRRPVRYRSREEIGGRQRRQQMLILVGVVFCFLFLTWYLALTAHHQAKRVAGGDTVPGLSVLGVPILSIGANEAHVAWLPGKEASGGSGNLTHHLLYLGGSDGTEVFYDATNSTVLRLPASSISVEVVP
jgi:hypothetical protein